MAIIFYRIVWYLPAMVGTGDDVAHYSITAAGTVKEEETTTADDNEEEEACSRRTSMPLRRDLADLADLADFISHWLLVWTADHPFIVAADAVGGCWMAAVVAPGSKPSANLS